MSEIPTETIGVLVCSAYRRISVSAEASYGDIDRFVAIAKKRKKWDISEVSHVMLSDDIELNPDDPAYRLEVPVDIFRDIRDNPDTWMQNILSVYSSIVSKK